MYFAISKLKVTCNEEARIHIAKHIFMFKHVFMFLRKCTALVGGWKTGPIEGPIHVNGPHMTG